MPAAREGPPNWNTQLLHGSIALPGAAGTHTALQDAQPQVKVGERYIVRMDAQHGHTYRTAKVDSLVVEGTHCYIYKALLLETGTAVAIKHPKTVHDQLSLFDEERLLRKMKGSNPNFVQHLGRLQIEPSDSSDKLGVLDALVLEGCPYGDLWDVFRKRQRQRMDGKVYLQMSSSQRYCMLVQLLSALAKVHSMNCCHTNVIPENILATYSPVGGQPVGSDLFSVLLAGFGSIAPLNSMTEHSNGITYYSSPEGVAAFHEKAEFPATEKSDIWGLGCVIAESFFGSLVREQYKHDASGIMRSLLSGRFFQDVVMKTLHMTGTVVESKWCEVLLLCLDQKDARRNAVELLYYVEVHPEFEPERAEMKWKVPNYKPTFTLMHGQAVLPEHLAVRAHVNEVIHASSPVSPLLSYSKRLLTPQEETRKVLAARVANQDDSSDSSLLQKESGRRMSLNNSNEELPPRQQALKHDIDMVVPVPVVLSVTTDGIKHHRASSCRSSSIFNMEAMETAPNNTHGHFNSSLNATKTLSIESTPKSARRSNASASTSLHLRACSARTNRSVTGSTVRRVFTNESLKGSSVSSLGGESYAAHDTLAQYAKAPHWDSMDTSCKIPVWTGDNSPPKTPPASSTHTHSLTHQALTPPAKLPPASSTHSTNTNGASPRSPSSSPLAPCTPTLSSLRAAGSCSSAVGNSHHRIPRAASASHCEGDCSAAPARDTFSTHSSSLCYTGRSVIVGSSAGALAESSESIHASDPAIKRAAKGASRSGHSNLKSSNAREPASSTQGVKRAFFPAEARDIESGSFRGTADNMVAAENAATPDAAAANSSGRRRGRSSGRAARTASEGTLPGSDGKASLAKTFGRGIFACFSAPEGSKRENHTADSRRKDAATEPTASDSTSMEASSKDRNSGGPSAGAVAAAARALAADHGVLGTSPSDIEKLRSFLHVTDVEEEPQPTNLSEIGRWSREVVKLREQKKARAKHAAVVLAAYDARAAADSSEQVAASAPVA